MWHLLNEVYWIAGNTAERSKLVALSWLSSPYSLYSTSSVSSCGSDHECVWPSALPESERSFTAWVSTHNPLLRVRIRSRGGRGEEGETRGGTKRGSRGRAWGNTGRAGEVIKVYPFPQSSFTETDKHDRWYSHLKADLSEVWEHVWLRSDVPF